MKNKILQLPLDRSKRHFIVGDIHGRYDTFLSLLASADYDPENDIIYGVGDLIDRGPKSYDVVNFFKIMKNVYSTIGNHEHMAATPSWHQVWLQNGGVACIASLKNNNVDRAWLEEFVETLPWVIHVGEDDEEGAFRIVHAEYPLSWDDDTIGLTHAFSWDVDDTFISGTPIWQTIIWSRDLITKAQNNVYNSNSILHGFKVNPLRHRHNYVGHTPIKEITTIADHTFLDTWGSRTMSMFEVITKQKYVVAYADNV